MEIKWVLCGLVEKIGGLGKLRSQWVEQHIWLFGIQIESLWENTILPPDGVEEGMRADRLL